MRRLRRLGLAVPVMLLVLALSTGAAWGSTGANEWGKTVTWGKELIPTSVPGVSEITAVAASTFGWDTNYAVSGGTVKSWGENTRGQLGSGSCCASRSVPETIPGLSGVVAISAGDESALAIKEGGTVWAWGTNVHGELGQGSISGPETCKSKPCSNKPIQVPGLEHVVSISAGDRFDLAVTESGTVYAWGLAANGRLGNGSTEGTVTCGEFVKGCEPTPQPVKELAGAVAVATGAEHGVALLSNGTVKDWGANEFGQLGNGTTESSTVPVAVSGLSEVTAIAAADARVVALKSDGTVRSWGTNEVGALGVGLSEAELEYSDTPLTVGGFLPLGNVTAISTSNGHTTALLSNGTLKGWGWNAIGQVGAGYASTEVDAPVAVTHAKEVSGIAAGTEYSLTFGAPAPILSSMSPTSGPTAGGNTVEIHGSNFTEVEAIEFGNKAATFEVVSSTLIKAVVPAGTPGRVPVTVLGPRGQGVGLKYLYVTGTETPEIGRCKKVAKEAGEFKGGNCLEKGAKSNYEWFPDAVKRGFVGSSPLETVLESVGKTAVKCTIATFEGELNSPLSAAGVKIAFKGCEIAGAGKCSSGATEGEIVTNPLEGVLGFESKELNNVGIQLQPEGGLPFAAFKCGIITANVRGAVVAQVSSPNGMHLTFNLKFKQSKGKQKPELLEGGPTAVLEVSFSGGSYEQLGLSMSGSFSTEEELEFNTVV